MPAAQNIACRKRNGAGKRIDPLHRFGVGARLPLRVFHIRDGYLRHKRRGRREYFERFALVKTRTHFGFCNAVFPTEHVGNIFARTRPIVSVGNRMLIFPERISGGKFTPRRAIEFARQRLTVSPVEDTAVSIDDGRQIIFALHTPFDLERTSACGGKLIKIRAHVEIFAVEQIRALFVLGKIEPAFRALALHAEFAAASLHARAAVNNFDVAIFFVSMSR